MLAINSPNGITIERNLFILSFTRIIVSLTQETRRTEIKSHPKKQI